MNFNNVKSRASLGGYVTPSRTNTYGQSFLGNPGRTINFDSPGDATTVQVLGYQFKLVKLDNTGSNQQATWDVSTGVVTASDPSKIDVVGGDGKDCEGAVLPALTDGDMLMVMVDYPGTATNDGGKLDAVRIRQDTAQGPGIWVKRGYYAVFPMTYFDDPVTFTFEKYSEGEVTVTVVGNYTI